MTNVLMYSGKFYIQKDLWNKELYEWNYCVLNLADKLNM
jgi:hypothetical protein